MRGGRDPTIPNRAVLIFYMPASCEEILTRRQGLVRGLGGWRGSNGPSEQSETPATKRNLSSKRIDLCYLPWNCCCEGQDINERRQRREDEESRDDRYRKAEGSDIL